MSFSHQTCQILDKFTNGVAFCVETDTGYCTVSEKLQEWLGLPDRRPFPLKDFFQYVFPDHRKDIMRSVEDASRSSFPVTAEFAIKKGEHAWQLVHCRMQLSKDQKGTGDQLVGFAQPVIHAGQSHNRTDDSLSWDTMARWAHDLRSPVAAISGIAESLALPDDLTREEQRRMTEFLLRETTHLQKLIDHLMQNGKTAGMSQPDPDKGVNVDMLLERAVARFEHCAGQKNIGIELDVTGGLRVIGSEEDLSRVVDNLLSNAIKFSERGQQVVLRSRLYGKRVVIEVQDCGIGMEGGTLKHLDSPGKQLPGKTGTAGEDSYGYGLSIVKHIVETHNGELHISSEKGRGTTVGVWFPAA